jgi:N utilization substance protein B
MLFSWDCRKQSADEAIESFYACLYADEKPVPDQFANELLRGAIEHLEEVDARIARHAEHWKMERMPAVDRNILRLSVYEMTHLGTPPAVAIDEALELARRFSSEESVQFLNGVLDAVRREQPPADSKEST